MIARKELAMPSLPSWYADGWRWIASLFNNTACLERPSIHPAPLEAEEVISDVRLRVQSRQF